MPILLYCRRFSTIDYTRTHVAANVDYCQKVLTRTRKLRDLALHISTADSNTQEHGRWEWANSFTSLFTRLETAVKGFERLPVDLKAIVTNGSLRLNPCTNYYTSLENSPSFTTHLHDVHTSPTSTPSGTVVSGDLVHKVSVSCCLLVLASTPAIYVAPYPLFSAERPDGLCSREGASFSILQTRTLE